MLLGTGDGCSAAAGIALSAGPVATASPPSLVFTGCGEGVSKTTTTLGDEAVGKGGAGETACWGTLLNLDQKLFNCSGVPTSLAVVLAPISPVVCAGSSAGVGRAGMGAAGVVGGVGGAGSVGIGVCVVAGEGAGWAYGIVSVGMESGPAAHSAGRGAGLGLSIPSERSSVDCLFMHAIHAGVFSRGAMFSSSSPKLSASVACGS